MRKILKSVIKFILFFLGWAIFSAFLPLSSSESPAYWRLWAEITPLLSIIIFTAVFWLIEKRAIKLNLFCNTAKGIAVGCIFGILWLGISVAVMFLIGVLRFESVNEVPDLLIWMTAVFLNVIMQELLVRGYLYQMLKQKHNIVLATILTTGLFVALHGGAFEAGFIPVMNVLTMSLLMSVVLEYTGSLVAPIIMHFIWNGMGAIILGGVSLAEDYPHLLNTASYGHDLLSGGTCKIEGSIVVFIVNVTLMILLTISQRKKVKQ